MLGAANRPTMRICLRPNLQGLARRIDGYNHDPICDDILPASDLLLPSFELIVVSRVRRRWALVEAYRHGSPEDPTLGLVRAQDFPNRHHRRISTAFPARA